jgi:hypothetical protein
MCRYYGNLGDDQYFNPAGYSANGLRNESASSQWVTCGIPKRDGTPKTINSRLYWWHVNTFAVNVVLDNTNATCRLWRRSADAVSYGYWPMPLKTHIANGRWNYGVSASDYNAGHLTTYGDAISVYCNVPSGAVVEQYRHMEYYD